MSHRTYLKRLEGRAFETFEGGDGRETDLAGLATSLAGALALLFNGWAAANLSYL